MTRIDQPSQRHERPETLEECLLRLLKEDPDNVDTLRLFNEWIEDKRREHGDSPDLNALVALDTGRLYYQAGLEEQVYDTFNDLLNQLDNEGRWELHRRVLEATYLLEIFKRPK